MEVQFIRGLNAMDEDEAKDMKKLAEEHDVELYVHAPYYTNIVDGDEVKTSFRENSVYWTTGKLDGCKNCCYSPWFLW